MKIRVMCAVPYRGGLDGGPQCVDGRGGQIYHNATPGFFVKDPSDYRIAVAVSFLLEYGPEEREVSHLAYVIGLAKMRGTIIGSTRNDFALNAFSPQTVETQPRRLATYENLPLEVRCSGQECGLTELSWALKVDGISEPIEALDKVHVRSWNQPNPEEFLSSNEYDRWLIDQSSNRLQFNRWPLRWTRAILRLTRVRKPY